MFDEVLIAGDRLTRTKMLEPVGDCITFKIRLPWYRSIYLSCLDQIELLIDGKRQSAEDIFFRLYGTTYAFADLSKHHAVLWFVLDQADILVRSASGSDRDTSEIALTLHFRVPYHRASNFRQVSTCTRTLPIEKRISL